MAGGWGGHLKRAMEGVGKTSVEATRSEVTKG